MAAGFYSTLWNSAKIALRAVWRAARQFFHEATGAVFGMFALYGAVAAWRLWPSRPTYWLLGFTIVYSVTMLVFAITSFRRARRVR
ncbi:MAG: hypothetical protein WA211_16490 [Candidatus Acidiferrales bacterium]|jgi:hypothetical protein